MSQPSRAFVFCSPVGVDSIPAISAKLMIAFRTDARPYNRNFLFATTTHDFYCFSLSLILPNYKLFYVDVSESSR